MVPRVRLKLRRCSRTGPVQVPINNNYNDIIMMMMIIIINKLRRSSRAGTVQVPITLVRSRARVCADIRMHACAHARTQVLLELEHAQRCSPSPAPRASAVPTVLSGDLSPSPVDVPERFRQPSVESEYATPPEHPSRRFVLVASHACERTMYAHICAHARAHVCMHTTAGCLRCRRQGQASWLVKSPQRRRGSRMTSRRCDTNGGTQTTRAINLVTKASNRTK